MNITKYQGHPPYSEGMKETEADAYHFLYNLSIEYSTLCHDAA